MKFLVFCKTVHTLNFFLNNLENYIVYQDNDNFLHRTETSICFIQFRIAQFKINIWLYSSDYDKSQFCLWNSKLPFLLTTICLRTSKKHPICRSCNISWFHLNSHFSQWCILRRKSINPEIPQRWLRYAIEVQIYELRYTSDRRIKWKQSTEKCYKICICKGRYLYHIKDLKNVLEFL